MIMQAGQKVQADYIIKKPTKLKELLAQGPLSYPRPGDTSSE
jgi:hypothetical protein